MAKGMHPSPVQGDEPKGETKSMSEFNDSPIAHTTGTPRWVGLAVAVLGGLSLLGVGVGWSALNQARTVEQTTQASVKQANDALSQRLAKSDEINQQLQSDVKVVTDKLKLTQGELIAARKQNKNATTAVDQKVTNLATSVKAELATKANSDDVNKLNGVNHNEVFSLSSYRVLYARALPGVLESTPFMYPKVPEAPDQIAALENNEPTIGPAARPATSRIRLI